MITKLDQYILDIAYMVQRKIELVKEAEELQSKYDWLCQQASRNIKKNTSKKTKMFIKELIEKAQVDINIYNAIENYDNIIKNMINNIKLIGET